MKSLRTSKDQRLQQRRNDGMLYQLDLIHIHVYVELVMSSIPRRRYNFQTNM